MTKVNADEIKLINELYYQYKNYAVVAKQLNRAPSTIKKYVVTDYCPASELVIHKFQKEDIPPFNPKIFLEKSIGELCVLSDIEKDEIRELWKELSM